MMKFSFKKEYLWNTKLSSQEMEKWLEEFTQYLEQYNRMSSNEVGLHQPHGFPARSIRQKLIPKTPAGGMQEQPEWWSKDPARKRNAELINNLLGLPRMMKVVG